MLLPYKHASMHACCHNTVGGLSKVESYINRDRPAQPPASIQLVVIGNPEVDAKRQLDGE